MSDVMCKSCGETGLYVTSRELVIQREWCYGPVIETSRGLEWDNHGVDDHEWIDHVETLEVEEVRCGGCERFVDLDDLSESHFAFPDNCFGEIDWDRGGYDGAVIAHYDGETCPAHHPVPAIWWDEESGQWMDGPEETEQKKAEQVAETVQTRPADGLAELLRDVVESP